MIEVSGDVESQAEDTEADEMMNKAMKVGVGGPLSAHPANADANVPYGVQGVYTGGPGYV